MKKRLISIILAVTLVVSLSACGKTETSNADIADLQKQIDELKKENDELKEEMGQTSTEEKPEEKPEKETSEENSLVDNNIAEEPETWSDDTVIAFTDEKMAEDVRELIGVPDGNITYGMVKDIKEFTNEGYTYFSINDGYEYNDITPIKYFTGLETLWIKTSSSDITPIENLQNLEVVGLDCSATDISPIAGLKNLNRLEIACSATDISPIAGLTNLNKLYLKCDATDISTIAGLKNLNTLLLVCPVEDLSPLSGLKELETAGIRNRSDHYENIVPATDLTAIGELQSLKSLCLYCSATDLSPLKNLKKLTGLDIIWANGEFDMNDIRLDTYTDESLHNTIQEFLDSV